MKEELITFETAKLAKEKGFDWQTRDGYHSDLQDNEFWEDWDLYLSDHYKKRLVSQSVYSAPTQSLLQKWLREVHKIYVNIDCDLVLTLWKFDDRLGFYTKVDNSEIYGFKTYEKALEKGLQEALKLI